MSPGSSTESYPAFARIGLRETPEKPQPDNLPRPGFEPGPPGFAARRDPYSTGVDCHQNPSQPPAWLSRLRRLPAGLKLRSGAVSIPAWADYLVAFFPRFSPTVRIRSSEFLEKYTQHTIPDESTLRKTYAPSIYDETIQKIRDEIKDSSIWVSIDETPDKEGHGDSSSVSLWAFVLSQHPDDLPKEASHVMIYVIGMVQQYLRHRKLPSICSYWVEENHGKNLNQVTCPDRDSNPGHLVSQPDALTVTPQVWTKVLKGKGINLGVSQHPRDQAPITSEASSLITQETEKIQTDSLNTKVMATVFWDRKGVLLLDFMPKGTTINANRYCETLRKLRRAIQNKRRGMLSRGVVLLHDNARPHTAASTRELLDQFGWEIFDHPPYSPELAPSDFHLFTKLKDFLGGTRFGSDEELKKTVNTWLNELAAEEYNTGILKLVNRYDKCLNVGGDYVEK
ncbi:hypothetical protein ANN_26471 [Periplaneta americana]|uniref:Transposase n=1 Tax=Periplaneta americana TaxID=6978 RepID=A0ABQ8RY62_PERAM|nr:hypothetical protein ANN_26471 [Periplaneta americana]